MLPRPDSAARTTGTAPAQHRSSSLRRDVWTGIDNGSVMGMEFIAAILTWTGIGWLLDRWLSTAPWLLAAGAAIGFSAGLYLVWLRSNQMNQAEQAKREQARADNASARGAGGRTPAVDPAGTREEGRGLEA